MEGNINLFYGDLANIIMMIPVGLTAPILVRRHKFWCSLLAVFLVETSIEGLQYFMMRGLCETDDVINGLIGGIIGYGIFKLLAFLVTCLKKDGDR